MLHRPMLAAALLLAATGLGTPAMAQRVEVGTTASVAGEVTLENAELRRPIKLEPRRRIAWGDLIATARNAQAQLLLLDRSTFGIGQNSRVRIDRFVYDPGKERSFVASLLKGGLRFFSGAERGARSGEVTTPAGRIGIRGTAVDMLVGESARDIAGREDAVGRKVRSDKQSATLVVLRGPVAEAGLTPGRVEVTGGQATVVLDQPGLAAYIPRPGAAPIGPFRISIGGLARVQDELAPRWARSLAGKGIPDEAIVGAAAAAVVGGILLGTRGNRDGKEGGIQSEQTCRDPQGQPIACPPRR